jgi:hypothetical protein
MFNLEICTAAPISFEQETLDKVAKTLDSIKNYIIRFDHNGKSLLTYIDEFKNAQAAGENTTSKETALTEAIAELIRSAIPQEIIDSINEVTNIPETLEGPIFELISKTFEKIKFNELNDMSIEEIIKQYFSDTKDIESAISITKNNQYDILSVIAHSIIEKNKTTNSAIKENTTTNNLTNLFKKYREHKDQQAEAQRLANEAAEAQRSSEAKKSTDEATKNPKSKALLILLIVGGLVAFGGGLYFFSSKPAKDEYEEYEEYAY